jgi:hypothetical protein
MAWVTEPTEIYKKSDGALTKVVVEKEPSEWPLLFDADGKPLQQDRSIGFRARKD